MDDGPLPAAAIHTFIQTLPAGTQAMWLSSRLSEPEIWRIEMAICRTVLHITSA